MFVLIIILSDNTVMFYITVSFLTISFLCKFKKVNARPTTIVLFRHL